MQLSTRHDPLSAAATAVAEAPARVQAPAPARTGLKKVSLAGIAKKKEDTAAKYPTFPDPEGKAAEIAARIAERQDLFDALKSALETDKAELGTILVRPWYLQHFHRKAEAPSSVLVNYTLPANPEAGTPEVKGAVRVTVKEQYTKLPSEEAVQAILGEQTERFFRQSFELKIDGDKLGDKAAELIERLQQLFAEHDCADALEAKECIVPVENFKALRLSEMDLAQSLALENLGEKGLIMSA